jgi:hypothetical protein
MCNKCCSSMLTASTLQMTKTTNSGGGRTSAELTEFLLHPSISLCSLIDLPLSQIKLPRKTLEWLGCFRARSQLAAVSLGIVYVSAIHDEMFFNVVALVQVSTDGDRFHKQGVGDRAEQPMSTLFTKVLHSQQNQSHSHHICVDKSSQPLAGKHKPALHTNSPSQKWSINHYLGGGGPRGSC